jgi:hypothetical protein
MWKEEFEFSPRLRRACEVQAESLTDANGPQRMWACPSEKIGRCKCASFIWRALQEGSVAVGEERAFRDHQPLQYWGASHLGSFRRWPHFRSLDFACGKRHGIEVERSAGQGPLRFRPFETIGCFFHVARCYPEQHAAFVKGSSRSRMMFARRRGTVVLRGHSNLSSRFRRMRPNSPSVSTPAATHRFLAHQCIPGPISGFRS